MRRRKPDLQARVNGDLPLRFNDVQLTSYAGLELFQRHLRRMQFNGMIRTAFGGASVGGDFGVVAMVRLLVGLLLIAYHTTCDRRGDEVKHDVQPERCSGSGLLLCLRCNVAKVLKVRSVLAISPSENPLLRKYSAIRRESHIGSGT